MNVTKKKRAHTVVFIGDKKLGLEFWSDGA